MGECARGVGWAEGAEEEYPAEGEAGGHCCGGELLIVAIEILLRSEAVGGLKV